jgi:uncharacterized protein (DUF362 family)
MLVYYLGKRFGWSLRTTLILGLVISVGPFMTGSTLLYLDVIDWPLPPTPGSVWMFHTNITGIRKADVPLALAIFMLLIYPLWLLLGDIFARKLDLGFIGLRELSYQDVKSRREKPTTEVAVRRGRNLRELVRDAVNTLGGIGRFVKEGDEVMIKANICGGNPIIPGSYTSMEVVEELVKMIREVGGKPFVVDSDMIWTKFDAAAEEEGWREWALRANVPLVNLNRTKQVRFNFGKGSAIGRVPVSKTAVKAEVIISVPTMKTHLLCNVTLGMKNMYGTFPEENKAKFHRFSIEDVIYEVNKALTPSLTVIDGTIGGEAWGPLSSRPVRFETVVASNDVVAADAVACQLMGYDPFEIAHIKMAHERGLGDGSIRFDFSALPYAHEKDGKWVRPEPSVSTFYEGLVEALLLLPGAQTLFDLAADFVLLEMARLPIFREMTPMTEAVLNDVLAGLFRSGHTVAGWTDDDLKKMQKHLEEFWKGIAAEGKL